MRDTTKKLSGPAKDKFLERFYALQDGLDAATADSLTRRSAETFSSVRVRAEAHEAVRQGKPAPRPAKAGAPALAAPVSSLASAPATAPATRQPEPAPPAAPAPQEAAKPAAPASAPAAKPFDPYAFGLVPVFQKEGRDAVLARLEEIASADQLRQMARAQQVSLPQPLRSGEVALDQLRTAILDAVAKRIADRKAAAG